NQPVFEQVAPKRPARTAGRRIFGNAEARREHAAVDRLVARRSGAIGREDKERQRLESGGRADIGVGPYVERDVVDGRPRTERGEEERRAARDLLWRRVSQILRIDAKRSREADAVLHVAAELRV